MNDLYSRITEQRCVGCGIGPDERECCKLLGVVFCVKCLERTGYQIVPAQEKRKDHVVVSQLVH